MDRKRLQEIWEDGLHHRSFVAGGILTVLMLSLAILSLIWTPYSVFTMNISGKLQPPGELHWLGTDHFGRDVLSMLMVGAWNSMAVSLAAIGMGALIGIPLGLTASARKGWIFPALLTAVMLSAALGPGSFNSIVAIGIFNIPVFARLTRGSSLSLFQRDFILAARIAGKGTTRICAEHILPNITSVLIVQATIQFALGILAEAGLSYLGLGTQPPQPSWGKMLSEAQTMMFFAPNLAILPGCAIVISVLGLNLLGDGMRDILDPKMRTRE